MVIHMPALQHIYLTAHGEWTASPFATEKAQIGIRLPIAAEADPPAKGTTFEPIANGDVVLDAGTQAGTNGTLTRTWKARLGPIASPDNAATMQADLADDMWAFLNSLKSIQSTVFKWTHVKIAPILATGAYGAPSAVYQFTAPLVGASAAGALPPELAVAVSFRAPIIGRRGRGRMYIPALALTQVDGANGTVLAAAQTSLKTWAGTLVTNLENLPGVEEYSTLVGVMSAGSSTAVRPSEVRVGNHWDMQKRRQDQAVETYSSAAL